MEESYLSAFLNMNQALFNVLNKYSTSKIDENDDTHISLYPINGFNTCAKYFRWHKLTMDINIGNISITYMDFGDNNLVSIFRSDTFIIIYNTCDNIIVKKHNGKREIKWEKITKEYIKFIFDIFPDISCIYNDNY